MKDQATVQKFIDLRSQGLSFARISEQLGVATGTLVNWSREHQHLIHNLRAIAWEAVVDRTLAAKSEHLQALADQLRRLEAELAGRDLATVPTPRLAAMAEQLRRRIEREAGSLQFTSSVQLSRDDETREAIQNWPA